MYSFQKQIYKLNNKKTKKNSYNLLHFSNNAKSIKKLLFSLFKLFVLKNYEIFIQFMDLNYRLQKQKSGYIKQRWGVDQRQQQPEMSLLSKKDLQIKRLQSQLENQRKKADNALRMLDSFRNSHKMEQQNSSNTKSEVSKRLKAEQEGRRLRAENEKLKFLLQQQMAALQQFQKQMQMVAKI